MRRLGVLLVTLFLLTVTSAFAAGLDVQSDNIESFTSDVSIPVPESTIYFVRNQPGDSANVPPGLLSKTSEDNLNRTHSKRIDFGGDLPPTVSSIADYGAINEYHAWETDPLPEPTGIVSPTAELLITETGGGSESRIEAGLYECQPSTSLTTESCDLLATTTASVADSGGSVSNITTVTFPAFGPVDIEVGNSIRLVVISQEGSFNIQWGYKTNRPASLELTFV